MTIWFIRLWDLRADIMLKNIKMKAIEGSSFCAPSFADDISRLSLSSKSLQDMINMCHHYSCVWRFQYNPIKCAIVTFNEFKRAFARRSPSWFVSNEDIQEKDEFVHFGFLCDCSSTSIIKHVDRNSVWLKRDYIEMV